MVAYTPSFECWKSEDAALITGNGTRFLTLSNNWPTLTCEIGGRIVRRPAVLVKYSVHRS